MRIFLKHSFFLSNYQKIPVRELRTSDKSDIVELAVIMKTGVCPFIVVFYGCLVRDVSINLIDPHVHTCTVRMVAVKGTYHSLLGKCSWALIFQF